MTLINEYPSLAEAFIDKGMLEAHGLVCHVEQDAMSELYPTPGVGNWGVRLYVNDSDAAEARQLLSGRQQ